jgi:hypothetical protein
VWDLRRPEWDLLASPDPTRNTEDFHLSEEPVPQRYAALLSRVVLVERLREVRALVGFTRIDSPGDFSDTGDVPAARRAPLSRKPLNWTLASEVRGEGLFLRLDEDAVAAWCASPGVCQREERFRQAHRQWRAARRIEPPDAGFPGMRYVLLHSLSHALIRQLAIECGYGAAGIRERIYARGPGEPGGPMAGILFYTSAPDSEGTLGGLVSLGRQATLGRHLDRALDAMLLCASDPLCAEHGPGTGDLSLHGAACHACLFAPETSCERGNKYLDRWALVSTVARNGDSFFPGAGSS